MLGNQFSIVTMYFNGNAGADAAADSRCGQTLRGDLTNLFLVRVSGQELHENWVDSTIQRRGLPFSYFRTEINLISIEIRFIF